MAMTSEHRERLRVAYSDLLEKITDVDRITIGLYSKNVFTDIMKENVEEKIGRRKKIGEILTILPRRGDGAFDTFYNLLVEYEEYDAADLLYPERAKVSRQSKGSPVLVHDDDDDEIPERWPDNELHDPGKVVVVPTSEDSPMKQRFDKASKGQGRTYAMSNPHRGIFLLISNTCFEDSKVELSNRDGTDKDEIALKSLFEQLLFDVEEYKDLKAKEILTEVQKWSGMDHTYYNCFACAILTHGEKDKVFGVDGETVLLEDIKNAVCASPSLVGKPKLFFIQACQGGKKDSAEGGRKEKGSEKQKEEDDSTTSDAQSGRKTSSLADVFVAQATVPDFVSWRNTKWGTWFIQAVVYIFAKFAHKHKLTDLMTDVNKLVSKAVTQRGFVQVSKFDSSQLDSFYFFPGLKIDCPQPQRIGFFDWPHKDYDPFKFEVTSVTDRNMKDMFKTGKDITGKTVYPLKKSKRGVCLIINNETFKTGLEQRNTADDQLAIGRLFQELEFNVQPRNNLTSEGMVEAVRTQAENIMNDKKDNDCFVCVILSHGTGANHGHIYGVDGKMVPLEKLQAEVDGANCPPLSGKPKIFIVQACGTAVGATKISAPAEGEAGAVPTTGLEAGMKNVSLEGKGDAPDASKIENPGSKSDFFTISANVPDMMTGVESGTLFIQTLACVFAKCCHNNDINALVTKVIKLAQKTNISEVVCDTKSSLTQSLYFFPGLNDEELILF